MLKKLFKRNMYPFIIACALVGVFSFSFSQSAIRYVFDLVEHILFFDFRVQSRSVVYTTPSDFDDLGFQDRSEADPVNRVPFPSHLKGEKGTKLKQKESRGFPYAEPQGLDAFKLDPNWYPEVPGIPNYGEADAYRKLSEIMIVGIDETTTTNPLTRAALGDFPYNRRIYAEYFSNFILKPSKTSSIDVLSARTLIPSEYARLSPEDRMTILNGIAALRNEHLVKILGEMKCRENSLYCHDRADWPKDIDPKLEANEGIYSIMPSMVMIDLFWDLSREKENELVALHPLASAGLMEKWVSNLVGKSAWDSLDAVGHYQSVLHVFRSLEKAEETIRGGSDESSLLFSGDAELFRELQNFKDAYKEGVKTSRQRGYESMNGLVVGGSSSPIFCDFALAYEEESRFPAYEVAARLDKMAHYLWTDEELGQPRAHDKGEALWSWDDEDWKRHDYYRDRYRSEGDSELIFRNVKPPLVGVLSAVGGSGAANVFTLSGREGESLRYMPLVLLIEDDRSYEEDDEEQTQKPVMLGQKWIATIDLALAMHYYQVKKHQVEIRFGEAVIFHDAHVPMFEEILPNGEVHADYGLLPPPCLKPTPPPMSLTTCVRDPNGYFRVDKRIKQDVSIPIDPYGRVRLNYYGASGSFPYRQFAHFHPGLNPQREGWQDYKNRILATGIYTSSNISGKSDTHETPVGKMFGIEVHANALHMLVHQDFVLELPRLSEHLDWVSVDFLAGCLLIFLVCLFSGRLSVGMSAFSVGSIFALCLFIPFLLYILPDKNPIYIQIFPIASATLLAYAVMTIYRIATESREKARIKGMFSSYVSADVVNQLVSDPEKAGLGGIDRKVTILFSDLAGFTTISESLSPQELVRVLNFYLGRMTDIVLKTRGTLDKYVGDAIMAFWGAPLHLPEHELAACRAALEMSESLSSINKELAAPVEEGGLGFPNVNLQMRLGINTGTVTVGNMGSEVRKDYTVLGDMVNLAARLEPANKVYGTEIMISEYTYEPIKDKIIARELDNLRVKGKDNSVRVYELLGLVENWPPKGTN